MELKYEITDSSCHTPIQATKGSAGLDLTAQSFGTGRLSSKGVVVFKTGVKVQIPPGFFGALYIRSSLAIKHDWKMANSVGVIDSDYRGEIKVAFKFVGCMFDQIRESRKLVGQRIAQLVIQPCVIPKLVRVDSLEETERGEGGFGSTDKEPIRTGPRFYGDYD